VLGGLPHRRNALSASQYTSRFSIPKLTNKDDDTPLLREDRPELDSFTVKIKNLEFRGFRNRVFVGNSLEVLHVVVGQG